MRRVLYGVILMLAASAAAEQEERLSERLKADEPGFEAYRQYCSSCHGLFADGKGLVAPVLKVPPTNLRNLHERYGSPLSKQKLMGYIDGTKPVTAHGDREMPVWGHRLYEDVPHRMPDARKRGMVLTIIDYLEAIQEAPAPES